MQHRGPVPAAEPAHGRAAGLHLRRAAGQGARGGLDQPRHPVRVPVAAAGRARLLHQRHEEPDHEPQPPPEDQVSQAADGAGAKSGPGGGKTAESAHCGGRLESADLQ